jgi:hypothetical protein
MRTSKYQKLGQIEYNKTTNLFATVNGSNADKLPFPICMVVEIAMRLPTALCANSRHAKHLAIRSMFPYPRQYANELDHKCWLFA